MTEPESPLSKFYKCVDAELARHLGKVEKKIREVTGYEKVEEIVSLLTEANSYVSLACGDDGSLYDNWRYRMFLSDGKIVIIQGEEVDVNYRDWMDSGSFFQNDDNKNGDR